MYIERPGALCRETLLVPSSEHNKSKHSYNRRLTLNQRTVSQLNHALSTHV